MVVAASHMGGPPQPFDTEMLSEPAEVLQWILRTDPYALERESDELRPSCGRKLAATRAKHNSRRAWMRGARRAGSQGDGPVRAGRPARGLAFTRGGANGPRRVPSVS